MTLLKKKKNARYDLPSSEAMLLIENIFIILILVIILFTRIIGVAHVSGDSMSPAFHNGEAVYYNRAVSQYKPGDVVVINLPDGEHFIKRIAAIPGETVEVRDGQLYVNGQVREFAQAQGKTTEEAEDIKYPLKLEQGQFFVLGDNRENSTDSRSFGPFVEKQFLGKVITNR